MDILDEQLSYYRARAAEYDEWFLRKGRYDRNPEVNQLWHDEVATVRKALDDFDPVGDVLELACEMTSQLADRSTSIMGVDAAEEVLPIDKDRVAAHNVTYDRLKPQAMRGSDAKQNSKSTLGLGADICARVYRLPRLVVIKRRSHFRSRWQEQAASTRWRRDNIVPVFIQ